MGMGSIFKGVLDAAKDTGERFGDNYAARAERDLTPRNASDIGSRGPANVPGAEGDPAWKPSVMDQGRAALGTYGDTMLTGSLGRKALGYGAPIGAAAGLGIGAYQQGSDGNTGGATVLGAGAAVIGGALALSHFGAVAAGGVERGVAREISQAGGSVAANAADASVAADIPAAASGGRMSGAVDAVRGMAASGREALGGVVDKVRSAASSVGSFMGESSVPDDSVLGRMAQGISDRTSSATSSAGSMGERAAVSIAGAAGNAYRGAKQTVQDFGQGALNSVAGVSDEVGRRGNVVTGNFSRQASDIPIGAGVTDDMNI